LLKSAEKVKLEEGEVDKKILFDNPPPLNIFGFNHLGVGVPSLPVNAPFQLVDVPDNDVKGWLNRAMFAAHRWFIENFSS
jgi:hypothetical protein